MDAHLKHGEPFPKPPVAEVRLGTDGVSLLIVKPDGYQSIRRVDLFYAVENRNPKNRYWRSAPGRKEFAVGWTQYAAEVALEPEKGWRTITLPADAFSTDKGEHLNGWGDVQQLELKTMGGAGEEPIYEAFRWLPSLNQR
jgi:hypothetical protein